MFIFDQAGDNIAASSSNSASGGNFNDREWLRQLRDGGEAPYIGRALKGRSIHNLFFPVARAVRGPDGKFIAAVQVGVEVTDIAELFGKLDLGSDGQLGLYRIRDGAIVARHPMTEALLEESVATLPFFPMLTSSQVSAGPAWPPQWRGPHRRRAARRGPAPDRRCQLPEAQAYADARIRLAWHVAAAAMLLAAFGALAVGALRQLKREVRDRLLEVIHLDRVAVVGAMSASIAHELNQPLGAILLNAETAEVLASADPIDRDQLKEILADIRNSDQRAGDIIAHLRGLLKKRGDVDFEEVDLTNSIRNALHMLEPETRKRGVLARTLSDSEGALLVRADPVHLEQVIFNLAANAMDAMEAAAASTRQITVQTAVVGNTEVEVSISDTGAGISNDKLKAIFETFYTTKQQGIGLGLSIVRTIVETYGGKIWAENRSDGGAVFRFTLPLSRAPAGIEPPAGMLGDWTVRICTDRSKTLSVAESVGPKAAYVQMLAETQQLPPMERSKG